MSEAEPRAARPEAASFDTMNRFLVTLAGAQVVILNPPREGIPREHALNLVAWIAALADLSDAEIREARQAVKNA